MNDPHPNLLALGQHSPDTQRYFKRAGISVLVILLVAAGLRTGVNIGQAQALQQRTQDGARHSVSVVKPKAGALQREVVLPGTLRGSNESPIYARTGGYVLAWYKTIGDKVRKGELLARLDAPEQDQELAQARAVRQQIGVRLQQAAQTYERWVGLQALDSVSRQDLDEKRSARDQASADLAAAEANVKRLEQLQALRNIVAPFDGVITRRGAEVGNLVASGGKELFAIVQQDNLRLTLWVPQAYAGDVESGQEVSVRVREQANKEVKGRISHVAGAIDPANRSRQIEISLANPDGKLLAGSYVDVSIKLQAGSRSLLAPASTIQATAEGLRIATVSSEGRVAFRKVVLGRDLGKEVEILGGITLDDRLIANPSDVLLEGELVAIREPVEKKPAASGDKKTATPVSKT